MEGLRARTEYVHLCCASSPYDFRALHNDFDILATLQYYFYRF